jgi:hypothetical protein
VGRHQRGRGAASRPNAVECYGLRRSDLDSLCSFFLCECLGPCHQRLGLYSRRGERSKIGPFTFLGWQAEPTRNPSVAQRVRSGLCGLLSPREISCEFRDGHSGSANKRPERPWSQFLVLGNERLTADPRLIRITWLPCCRSFIQPPLGTLAPLARRKQPVEPPLDGGLDLDLPNLHGQRHTVCRACCQTAGNRLSNIR